MHILVCGWSVAAVEEDPPWSYSIGVLEKFAHPELVVMDMEIQAAGSLINYVGSQVRDGGGFLDHDALRAEGIRLVDVHERHMRSRLFKSWTRYYGEQPQAGDFVQILPPPELFCPCHRHAYRRLDRVA
ncbi:MAG: DUF4262 domain-containing protein [Ilumatobacteraceae bacterium]